MGRITEEEAQKYSASNGSWFQLKNDKDIATVQFMHDNPEDLAPYVCHRVKVGDRERYVDCLATYGEECPLCHAGHQQKLVRFVVMYQHEDNQMKIWERGKNFIQQIQGHMNRCSNFPTWVFQIERNGKAGDMKTTYNLYNMGQGVQGNAVDTSNIEIPQIMGKVVLQKNAVEMETYLQTGNFPNDEVVNDQPIQRRSAYQDPSPTPRQPVSQVSRRDVPVSDRGVF